MLIKIIENLAETDSLKVKFSSEFGNGTALWSSSHPKPKAGEEYDVELEIDEIFTWGLNAKAQTKVLESINTIESKTVITAKAISIQQNCTALKIGKTIILIELKEPPTHPLNHIELTLKKLQLYPTNI